MSVAVGRPVGGDEINYFILNIDFYLRIDSRNDRFANGGRTYFQKTWKGRLAIVIRKARYSGTSV